MLRARSTLPITFLFVLCSIGTARSDTLVYSNTGGSSTQVPGAGIFVSDDLTLDGGAAMVTSYQIQVSSSGSSNFQATTTLFSGDPCVGSPSQIAGSGKTFPDLTPGTVHTLTATFGTPLSVPGTVYMKVIFNDDDAGWVIGGTVEIGSSQDRICQDQTSGTDPGYLNLGATEASMWVQIWAQDPTPVAPGTWGRIKARY
jgi:hypothetical protein